MNSNTIKPITLKPHEVRHLLKTGLVRISRIVKPQPPLAFLSGDIAAITNGKLWTLSRIPGKVWHPGKEPGIACPCGIVGDKLWVRETWNLTFKNESLPEDFIKTPEECVKDNGGFTPPCADGVVYRVSSPGNHPHLGRAVWRSPVVMPQWASRLTVETKSVTIKRIQEITEEEARESGFDGTGPVGHIPAAMKMGPCRYDFANMWDHESWERNDWVWSVVLSKK